MSESTENVIEYQKCRVYTTEMKYGNHIYTYELRLFANKQRNV